MGNFDDDNGDDGKFKMEGPRIQKLEHPISVRYLKDHLNPATPRMILTPENEGLLLRKLKTDKVLQNMKKAVHKNTQKIKALPLLEHQCKGKRMLEVSREMLYRVNVLSMQYYLNGRSAPAAIDRIDRELLAVCAFCDWNPRHFLDVGEMCMAVALAIDWVGHELPGSTVKLARESLKEKGIVPSYAKKQFWMEARNNWNQVCHSGLVAASVAIADIEPELAARTIKRALDCLPHALAQYGPDGVYPEGPAYWEYGTSYTALASSILETALGSDFGISNYPSFQASAVFRAMSGAAPTGWFYNFSDCADRRSRDGDLLLAWFATRCGNRLFYEEERFLRDYNHMAKLNTFVGAGIIWLSQFEPCASCELPSSWQGGGCNPVAFFTAARDTDDDDSQYYFAAKGGKASNSHANMDGGSFIFELDGVRWVIDPGSQKYLLCEEGGIDLWNQKQDSSRWSLLTKNNYGHSTLTVNNELHRVDGMATMYGFHDGENPTVAIDMEAAFGGKLKKATRRFTKDSTTSLMIEDELVLTKVAELVTWQLMTTADVSITQTGAMLSTKDGKSLQLELLSEPKVPATIVELDPPPLPLDRTIEGLKRIELRFPACKFEGFKGSICVRLSRGGE